MKKTKISLRPLATGRSGIRTRSGCPAISGGTASRCEADPGGDRLLGLPAAFRPAPDSEGTIGSATHLRRDPRIKAVEWHDLLELSPGQKARELGLSLPWLLGSLTAYHFSLLVPGLLGSFFFFLTGLRQTHGAQHYSLGLDRRIQDGLLFSLSVLMLASMHAIQVTHMHHHRHCLDEDDVEASTSKLPWWAAILAGPGFIVRLHIEAWRLAKPKKRVWIVAELLAIAAWLAAVFVVLDLAALRTHALAMIVGECLTGFFAVWTVHHDCDPEGQFARTQRGPLKNLISYEMFYHLEHHLFPAVPTPRLPSRRSSESAAASASEYRPWFICRSTSWNHGQNSSGSSRMACRMACSAGP